MGEIGKRRLPNHHAYGTVSDARMSIMEYMDWYNQKRSHSRLGKKTHDEAYDERKPPVRMGVRETLRFHLRNGRTCSNKLTHFYL
ncbi:integrase core domain-containing protein [Desulfomicrobium sp. ZS1]|uniref:integrase core domain-containing protein n=1 Tax=Desulfomicrobium sp. ZS1 TaxID=2952228 RepID=UPI003530A2E1